MNDRPPSKRWRVYGARGLSTDHRSERAVYEAAETIVNSGTKATIRHWEDGRWVLYEVLEPSAKEA